MPNRIVEELLAAARNGRRERYPHQQDDSPDWKEQAQMAGKQVTEFVASHPLASMSVAVTAGVLLGWMVKRR